MNENLPSSENFIDGRELRTSRDPSLVLEEAAKAATALKDVIAKKKKPVIMNGEQYLEFEDWQTVGKFYGITAKVTSTEFVELGKVKGFLARAVAVNMRSGDEISAAEAMCLNDEEKWSARTKYEWQYVWKSTGKPAPGEPPKDELIWEKGNDGKMRPKRMRVVIGEESVPLFQLRSMAQTRACAKVFRNVLAWVVVLAGYKPTPAEEIDGVLGNQEPTGGTGSEPKQTGGDEAKEEKAPAENSQDQPAQPSTPPALSRAQQDLANAILSYTHNDQKQAKEILHKLTTYTAKGKTYDGKQSIRDCSDAMATRALDRFNKEYGPSAGREPGED